MWCVVQNVLTAPMIVSLSLSLSLFLRFNLNAQICNGYNGAFDSFGKKEGKKRFLEQKETRLLSAALSRFLRALETKKATFSLFLSLSLSLSLTFFSLFQLSRYFIRLREHDVQWKLTTPTRA